MDAPDSAAEDRMATATLCHAAYATDRPEAPAGLRNGWPSMVGLGGGYQLDFSATTWRPNSRSILAMAASSERVKVGQEVDGGYGVSRYGAGGGVFRLGVGSRDLL
jgi:hypothetical protein